MGNTDVKARLKALRLLLEEETPSTQEELRDKLEHQDFDVTQSTISRDLRRLGAIRTAGERGQAVYRLPDETEVPLPTTNVGDLIWDITSNGSLIVINTAAGSAPLVARYLDRSAAPEILGTIAGDDTIFVAPASSSTAGMKAAMKLVKSSLNMN